MKKIIMPKVGLTMQSGIIERWLKKEGDYVEKGDLILEITTDKTNIEVESTDSGYLRTIVAKEGEEIPVNSVIAYLYGKDEVISDFRKELVSEKESNAQEVKAGDKTEKQDINISPLAKKLAEELDIDLNKVQGTGPRGRILKEDIIAASESLKKVEKGDSEKEITSQEYGIKVSKTIKLSVVKKLVGQRVKDSHLNAPPICLTLSCDMSEAKMKKDSAAKDQLPITFTDIIICATAKALRLNLILNSTLKDDEVIVFEEINIGIATETPKGLLVPVIKKADTLSFSEIINRREELITKARNGKLTREDVEGGTFTVTNLGMFGIEYFEPIIVPNQAAILSTGTIKMTPVANEMGQLIIKPVMYVSITCDHRIVDGIDGARFLVDFKKLIESCENMF